jgi:hypothetical protein
MIKKSLRSILFSLIKGRAAVKELSYVCKCSGDLVYSYLKKLKEKNEENIISRPVKIYRVPLGMPRDYIRIDQDDKTSKEISKELFDYIESTGIIPAIYSKKSIKIMMKLIMDEGTIELLIQGIKKAAEGVLEVIEVNSPETADNWRETLELMAGLADHATEILRWLNETPPQIVKTIDEAPNDELRNF